MLYRIESYCGTDRGWLPASADKLAAADAARRLALYRAVRGDSWLFRAAPVLLPGETAATVAALPRPAVTGASLPAFV